ncbi:MAG: GntR family transcriptional regulator, partial [Desulfosarcinaceae bacterium]
MNQKIYKAIRDRILFLEYEPGQILNEQQLAKEFNVSRTPLREVLSRLEWEHLVRILPRTGTMIAEIELNTIMNVFQVRLGIEEMVGKMAAEHFGQARIEKLNQLRMACGRISVATGVLVGGGKVGTSLGDSEVSATSDGGV